MHVQTVFAGEYGGAGVWAGGEDRGHAVDREGVGVCPDAVTPSDSQRQVTQRAPRGVVVAIRAQAGVPAASVEFVAGFEVRAIPWRAVIVRSPG